jgi:hypothetical protein
MLDDLWLPSTVYLIRYEPHHSGFVGDTSLATAKEQRLRSTRMMAISPIQRRGRLGVHSSKHLRRVGKIDRWQASASYSPPMIRTAVSISMILSTNHPGS